MKPILHALTCAAIATSLVGCSMNSGKTRTSSTAVSPDTPRVVTSDRVTVPDDTRMRTVDRTRMHQSTEDVAIASAVKERIADDRTVNPRRITVEADRGTVYLNGSVDSRDQKIRAEQLATQVAGVSNVVNQLRVREGDERNAIREDRRSCTLVSVIPATRTESSFGAVQVRVFDDISSPLYPGARDTAYEPSERAYDERRRGMENRPHDLGEVTPRVPVMPGETTPSGSGPTGGTMQNSGSAQQGGTLEQTGRSGDTTIDDRRLEATNDRSRYYDERSLDAPRARRYDDRTLAYDERARLYGDEARLSDRRGNLIWSGWLKNGERLDISSERGPIRYDYRYTADDQFHDNKGVWCNDGNRVIVP